MKKLRDTWRKVKRRPLVTAAILGAAALIAAAAVVTLVLAFGGGAPPLDGVCFSPYLEEEPPSQDRVRELVETVAPYTGGVRTFGSTDEWASIPSVARRNGLYVAAGAGVGADRERNKAEIEALLKQVEAGEVDLAVVGDELLMWEILPEDELVSLIEQVKAAGVPAGTSDSWDEFLAHPRLVETVDVLLVNVFPYWEGVAVDEAVGYIDGVYEKVKAVAGGREIIVETGWPSGGDPEDDAVPGPVQAARFLNEFTSWARDKGVRYFYFEAFDEPWKLEVEGSVGPYWGLWDSEGVMKPYARPILEGEN